MTLSQSQLCVSAKAKPSQTKQSKENDFTLKVESFSSAKAKVKLNHSDITAVCMSQGYVIFIKCEASS